MKSSKRLVIIGAAAALFSAGILGVTNVPKSLNPKPAATSEAAIDDAKELLKLHITRGAYLVAIGGCNDCHTPWKMGPERSRADMTGMLLRATRTM